MFRLEKTREEIAEKVFGFQKATMVDIADYLQTTTNELQALNDQEYLELMFLYCNNYCEVS